MWYKVIISFLAIIAVVILQISVLGNWGTYWSSFNFILAILVVLVGLIDFRKVIFFAIASGLILDIYSSLPFGVFLFTLFFTAVISELLFINFFNSRSFYPLLFLGGITIVVYHLLFLSFAGLAYALNLSDFYIDSRYWFVFLYQFINTLLILVVALVSANVLSKRFKPNFLRS